MAAKVAAPVAHPFTGTWNGFTVEGVSADSIAKVAADARVRYIEPIMRVHSRTVQSVDGDMWNLDRVDQRNLPFDSQYQYLSTASTTTVHVIDSGINAGHQEFANRPFITVMDCWNLGTSPPGCFSVTNFLHDDCEGHGTAVASMVGGVTFGVAKQVRLRGYIMKDGAEGGVCYPQGGADTNDFAAAINAAIAASASDGGPSIINMSVGFSGVNTTVENRIQAALNAGITVVVAAGNDNRSACLGTPERMPGVITVAASNIDDTRLPQSNYGNCVDLFAPGGGIAAGHQSNSQEVGFGGTSAAAPMVAGIAALHLEDNESHTPAQVANAIINGSTLNVITNRGCVNPPSGNCSPNRLAYSLLAGPPAGTLQFSSATFTSSEVTPAVSITVTRSVNTSGPVSVTVAASNGSATAGSDYSAPSAVLNWGNGDGAPKVFTVNVTDDAIYEGNETVNLTLQSPTGGAVLGSPATAILTINENDPPPGTIVLSAANYEGLENGGSITITAMRTGGNGGAVSAQYNTANGSAVVPSDYGSASGALNWANGDASNKTFAVVIADDAVAEPNETFTVTLTNPTGGATIGSPSSATVKVVDNDTPVPSTPASIWTDPLGESYTGNWQVVWNPAIGPVNYYSLEETSDLGVVNHTIPYPSAFKDYTHQVFYRRFYFRVKACNVNDQCSPYTAQTFIDVCGSGVCP